MPEFSMIVPAYQAEKMLHRCLDSILGQTYPDFEVIVIDDGSRDETMRICREYARKDARIIAYTQKNAGVSAARNRGLSLAKGNWIAFVDADDSIAPEYLARLHDTAKASGADVVFMGYQQTDAWGKASTTCLPPSLAGDQILDLVRLSETDMFGYTWIKVFAREVLEGICFREDMQLFEDEVFACECLQRCKKIAVVQAPLYNYVTGSASALTGRTYQDYCEKNDAVYGAWKVLLRTDSRCAEIMRWKADGMVARCMYYGYERSVDVKAFFAKLAECAFFQERSIHNAFTDAVAEKRAGSIWRMRQMYRLKNKLAYIAKRKRG